MAIAHVSSSLLYTGYFAAVKAGYSVGNFDVGSGANRALIIYMNARTSGNNVVPTIKFGGSGGATMNASSVQDTGTDNQIIFYLLNPASGSNSVWLSWTGSDDYSYVDLICASYTGVASAQDVMAKGSTGGTTGPTFSVNAAAGYVTLAGFSQDGSAIAVTGSGATTVRLSAAAPAPTVGYGIQETLMEKEYDANPTVLTGSTVSNIYYFGRGLSLAPAAAATQAPRSIHTLNQMRG